MGLGSMHNAFPMGRPSGLPDDIVEQLVQARRQQRLQPIEARMEEAEKQKDAYTGLNETLLEVFKAADQLQDPDRFEQYIAGAQDESVAVAEATGQAQRGNYELEVQQTARAQHLLLGLDNAEEVPLGLSDPDDPQLLSAGAQISFFHQEQEYSYTVQEDTSLNDLVQQINEDENDINAQVLNLGGSDDPQYVLSLKSQDTGAGTNRITTDEAGQDPGLNIDVSGTEENSLFLDVEGQAQDHQEQIAQEGRDAQFTLDGASMTRSDNEIKDAINGVTLELQSPGATRLAVAQDQDAVSQMVARFVETYNNFDQFLQENATYDEDADEAGPLLGDSVTRTVRNRLSSIIAAPVAGAPSDFQHLSDIGLEVQRDRSLSLDQGALQDALSKNPHAVQELFASEDGAASRLASFLKSYTSTDGIINSNIQSQNNSIQRLENRYDREMDRLVQYQERQVRTFTNMEQAIMKYQSTESQLQSMIDAWDRD